MSIGKKIGRRAALAFAVAALAGACSTIDSAGTPALAAGDTIAVLPLGNYTETPDAGQSAQAMSANALRGLGVANVVRAPADPAGGAYVDGAQRGDGTPNLEWARQQHARYALAGAVEEWRYKVGVDGEPAVGVTFELFDVESGKVLWSATGTRIGWSRSGLASVAQTLIGKLLSPLRVHG